MVEKERGDLRERLLERQALARTRGHFFATLREILVERFGVARELRAELFDLPAEIARVGVLDGRFLLALRELLAANLHEGDGGARALERRAIRAGGIGGLLRSRGSTLGELELLANTRGLLLLGAQIAERARFFVGELFDLSSDFGAERTTAAFERLELSGVRSDLALEARGTRCEVPRLRERLADLGRRVPRWIRARDHAREKRGAI